MRPRILGLGGVGLNPMRTLKTSEAAAVLKISPNTLRAWEERFGYPRPQRSPGRHRLYSFAEIDALREALHGGLSASSAVSAAKESVTTDVLALVNALCLFKRSRADAVMEASLGICSLERTVQGLLLEALEAVLSRKGSDAAAWEFALGWATDWLRRAQRLVGSQEMHGVVIIAETTEEPSNLITPYSRALELFCARGGLKVLAFPVRAVAALQEAIDTIRPDALIIAGSGRSEAVGRWVYAARSAVPHCTVAYYLRRATPESGSALLWLANDPSQAQRQLFEALERSPTAKSRSLAAIQGIEPDDDRRLAANSLSR